MKRILIIVFSFLSQFSFAQDNLSLEEAVTKGLKSNFSVVSIKKREIISDINNSWAKAGAIPSLDFLANYRGAKDNNNMEDFDQANLNASIEMNWILFSGFTIRISKEKLATLNILSKGNSAVLMENTIQDIIFAYYLALLEKEKLNINNEIFSLSNDRYKKVKLQRELGNIGTYQELQAKNSYLEDKSKLLLQKSVYNNAIRNLNYLLGESSEQKYILTTKFIPTAFEYKLSNLLDKMFSNNNILKNQYLSIEMKDLDIRLARSVYFPKLFVRAGGSYRDSNTDYDARGEIKTDGLNMYGSLNISYKLFDAGNKRRALRIAKIEKEIGEVSVEDMKMKLSNQMAASLEMYNVRKEMYLLSVENMKAVKLNLQISKEKYDTGAINSFNYRDIQILYLNVALAKLNSIYNLIGANTKLIKLTGGLLENK